ncbi:MAG: PD-(D/E)XK nuclease family protein [Planctomycetota bacterium]|nr:PD-(D/E)XK nuclease family protein [Planctomycetota bacterium]
MSGVRREFLGWSEPALPIAADWLLEKYGADMSALTMVLPGRRAGRRLIELLVQRAPAAWSPPQMATLAEVTDMLVDYPRPRAGVYQRALCWTMALQNRDSAELKQLLNEPPQPKDLQAWWKLAEMLDRLHSELAAESLTFADVLGNGIDGRPYLADSPAQETRRWQVLAQVQAAYAQALDDAGVCDHHLERTKALRVGNMQTPSTNLVLLGVASANRLQRQMLAHIAHQHTVTSLVVAPDRLANHFDDAGFLFVDAWQEFDLGFEDNQWSLVDSPEQQAEEVVRALHRWSGELAHDEVTLGILDAEHLPTIERHLAERGVPLRSPEGTLLSQSPPLRLLLAVADWLETRSFESFATLLRHPDVEDLCTAHLGAHDSVGALDRYFEKHLPHQVDGHWLEQTPLALAHKLLLEQLEELVSLKLAATSSWSARILHLLQAFYGHRELDRSRESDRKLALALQQLATAATEFAELGDSAAGRLPLSASQAIRLFVKPLLSAQIAPGRTATGSIEAVGWLELPLDDAPALIVTDFREGAVPAPLGSTVFLPESLRDKLHMANHAERLARDLYSTAVLLQSRVQASGKALFLCCRHRADGESLLPSRLLFHCEDDLLPARALAAFRELPSAARVAADDTLHGYVLPGPRDDLPETSEVFSASRLNTYLHSPYEYYLKYVCKARTRDDDARELDPLNFGNLMHKVLEDYGRDSDMREVCDASAIARHVHDRLEQRGLLLFGADMRPTIRLQLLQMRHRLQYFAERQAELMEEGWRIHAVEWKPPEENISLLFGDQSFLLQGQIDRIDRHTETGCWRIYDYKSGDKARAIKDVYKRRSNKWLDVQLPLYHYLAESLVGGRPSAGASDTVQLGYFNLPKSHKGEAIDLANWSADAISKMEEIVAEAVNGIRHGDFFDPDQKPPRDPRLAVLAGVGLLVPTDSRGDEEEDEEEAS